MSNIIKRFFLGAALSGAMLGNSNTVQAQHTASTSNKIDISYLDNYPRVKFFENHFSKEYCTQLLGFTYLLSDKEKTDIDRKGALIEVKQYLESRRDGKIAKTLSKEGLLALNIIIGLMDGKNKEELNNYFNSGKNYKTLEYKNYLIKNVHGNKDTLTIKSGRYNFGSHLLYSINGNDKVITIPVGVSINIIDHGSFVLVEISGDKVGDLPMSGFGSNGHELLFSNGVERLPFPELINTFNK